jgi:hypothetical protein
MGRGTGQPVLEQATSRGGMMFGPSRRPTRPGGAITRDLVAELRVALQSGDTDRVFDVTDAFLCQHSLEQWFAQAEGMDFNGDDKARRKLQNTLSHRYVIGSDYHAEVFSPETMIGGFIRRNLGVNYKRGSFLNRLVHEMAGSTHPDSTPSRNLLIDKGSSQYVPWSVFEQQAHDEVRGITKVFFQGALLRRHTEIMEQLFSNPISLANKEKAWMEVVRLIETTTMEGGSDNEVRSAVTELLRARS